MKLTIALKGNGDVEIQAEAEIEPRAEDAAAVAAVLTTARNSIAKGLRDEATSS